MFKTHVCPPEIVALFADPDTIEVGRDRASRWAGTLNLQPNDMVWMPELGWLIRCDEQGDADMPAFH